MQNFLAGQGLNADVLANDVRKASGTASDALTQAKPTVDSTVVTPVQEQPYPAGRVCSGRCGPLLLCEALLLASSSN